jgi:aminoglycoside N3'-acetyltransferase
MNREEYLIYCLLYAIDAANVKKQNLVQMSLKVDTVNFVKIYNVIQQQDEATRKNVIAKHADLYDKKEMIEEIRNTFLSELEPSIQEKICKYL